MFKIYETGFLSAIARIDYVMANHNFIKATQNGDGYWTIYFVPLTREII